VFFRRIRVNPWFLFVAEKMINAQFRIEKQRTLSTAFPGSKARRPGRKKFRRLFINFKTIVLLKFNDTCYKEPALSFPHN